MHPLPSDPCFGRLRSPRSLITITELDRSRRAWICVRTATVSWVGFNQKHSGENDSTMFGLTFHAPDT